MDYKNNYEMWLNSPYFDEQTKNELLSIKDDEKEIQDRFYKNLEFGTGGLRGIIGAELIESIFILLDVRHWAF